MKPHEASAVGPNWKGCSVYAILMPIEKGETRDLYYMHLKTYKNGVTKTALQEKKMEDRETKITKR